MKPRDGTEALDAAQRLQFDLILMDCRMPRMDGYEAARQIRARYGAAGQVPIIALTASAFKEDRIRAEQAGMNDFIAKPFQEEELVQKCLSWLPSSRPGASAETPKETNAKEPRARLDARPTIWKSTRPTSSAASCRSILESAPPVFERLVASIESSDWEQARTSAHWLRGGASRLIAPELQDRLTKIESACGSDAPDISNAEM